MWGKTSIKHLRNKIDATLNRSKQSCIRYTSCTKQPQHVSGTKSGHKQMADAQETAIVD
jgi:hypothetical protein